MSKKYERKFYVQLSSGEKFMISELDYNNIMGRMVAGKTTGYYHQRGSVEESDRHGWQVAFKDIASVYADKPELKDETIRNIDIDKRKPVEPGKPVKAPSPPKCNHDWNNPADWNHVTTIVGGVNRYFKQCASCGARSMLVKKREVELAQEAIGQTIDDVPLVN